MRSFITSIIAGFPFYFIDFIELLLGVLNRLLKDYMIVTGVEVLERLSFTGFYKTLYESQGKKVKIYLVDYEDGPPLKERPKTVIEVLVPEINSRHEMTSFSREEHDYYQRVIGNTLPDEMDFWLDYDFILENGKTRDVVVIDFFPSKELKAKAGGNRWMIVAGIEGLDQFCRTGFLKLCMKTEVRKLKCFW